MKTTGIFALAALLILFLGCVEKAPSAQTPAPGQVACKDGEVETTTCPDGVTKYVSRNCVEGKWHDVMY